MNDWYPPKAANERRMSAKPVKNDHATPAPATSGHAYDHQKDAKNSQDVGHRSPHSERLHAGSGAMPMLRRLVISTRR